MDKDAWNLGWKETYSKASGFKEYSREKANILPSKVSLWKGSGITFNFREEEVKLTLMVPISRACI